jgi:hypothetical protein
MSLLQSSIGSMVPSAGLNFKAYEQEMPKYPTINQPQGGSFGPNANSGVQKETLKNNPVFNTPMTNTMENQSLKVTNVKQVWGNMPSGQEE